MQVKDAIQEWNNQIAEETLGRVREELDEQLERAVQAFSETPGVSADLAESLVAQGFLSFDDLSVIEPDQLAEMGGLTEEQCDVVVEYAERESERLEQEQRQRRVQDKVHSNQEHDRHEQERRSPRVVEKVESIEVNESADIAVEVPQGIEHLASGGADPAVIGGDV